MVGEPVDHRRGGSSPATTRIIASRRKRSSAWALRYSCFSSRVSVAGSSSETPTRKRWLRFGVVRASYTDFGDLWSPFPTGVAPSGAFCKSLDEDHRAALRENYRRRLGVGDGPFELTARAWAATGIVP